MMKTLTVLLALTLSVMFSSTSFAGWTKVTIGEDDSTYYADLGRLRSQGNYVYYWTLHDYFKPTKFDDLSAKIYGQVDCKLLRSKTLTWSTYTRPMGRGAASSSSSEPDENWNYPIPNSVFETVLKAVCRTAKYK